MRKKSVKKRKKKSAVVVAFEKRMRLKEYEKTYIEGRVTDEAYVRRTFREWLFGLGLSDMETSYIGYNLSVGNNFLFVRGMSDGEYCVLKWVLRLNTVTQADLEKRAVEYARTFWDREFDIPIEVVKTYWKRQYGAYSYRVTGEPVKIGFSEKTMYAMTENKIYDTLLHELVHWHLHTSGLPYRDTDEAFIRECRRVGASLSGATYAMKAASRLDRG